MKVFFILLFFIPAIYSFGQDRIKTPCLFDEYSHQYQQAIARSEQIIRDNITSPKQFLKAGNVRVIPVVVHVIHNGGIENISEAQIQSQFEVLNEDYRKMAGSNGDGNGMDSEIEFRLAKINPDGKCTNGIVRIQSTLTNHQTHQRSQLSDLSFWDNTRYLNVYVVKSINNGSAGYASFPGGPDNDDGIVILHNYFGKTGTAAGLGRTMTHEAGHWLGLYHTFNNGCGTDTCLDGDYVCDTPPAASPTNFNCPVKNSCTNDFPDINDQVQNYLDYSSDACMDMFTNGQKQRMDATLNTLRWNIWQPSNVSATGCDSSYVSPPCNVIADFTSNGKNICKGSAVNFINKSQNSPVTYQWYFPGGNPSASAIANPTVIYDSVGIYPVTLAATNAIGSDSLTHPGFIVVSEPVPGASLTYSEGFENIVFPPVGITVENPDTGVTWERDTLASVSGIASVKINNLINTNYGQGDAFILPELDMLSYPGTPYLSFKWAYARTSTIYSDELIVLLSKDCGLNFTQIYYKTGNALATAPVQTTPFIPDSTQWKSAKISLANYITYNNVIIKFVNVTDGGNNLYIDNIQVGDTAFISETNEINSENLITIFPNPANSGLTIKYTLPQAEKVNLSIYNIEGKKLILMENKNQEAGVYSLPVNPDLLSPGIYFLQIDTGTNNIVRKKFVISGR